MGPSQPASQLSGELLIAALAGWTLVILIELAANAQLAVAHGARKVMHAPGLVQRSEHITSNDLVANIAEVAKQLMVMYFTVRQSLLLVMTVPMERFLTLGAHEMLHMPMLSKCCDNSLLNRTTTGTTYRNAHLVMATQAVQIVHIIGSISWAMFDFASSMIKFHPTGGTSKVVTMIHFSTEAQWLSIDHSMALEADVVLQTISLSPGVTRMAQCTPLVPHKTSISQLSIARLAVEAFGVPVGIHSFYHASNHKFTAFATAGSKQDVEITLTIFTTFKLIKYSIRECAETLCTYKALRVPQFPTRVHNFLMRLKAISAAGAVHVVQRHGG